MDKEAGKMAGGREVGWEAVFLSLTSGSSLPQVDPSTSCFSQSVLGTSEFEDFILLVSKGPGPRGPGQWHRT